LVKGYFCGTDYSNGVGTYFTKSTRGYILIEKEPSYIGIIKKKLS